MPVYEYKCKKCGKVITEVKSVDERNNLPVCNDCKIKMDKIMSSGMFIINGYSEANGYSKKV